MTSVVIGILMLILTAVATYIYFTKLGKQPSGDWDRSRPKGSQTTALKEHGKELTIENVRVGGLVSVKNVGPQMEEFDAKVTRHHLYKSGLERWYELELDRGSKKVYLTLHLDDELELHLSLERLKFGDLGLSRADFEPSLAALPQELSYQGESFILAAKGAAQYCKDQNELAPEAFQYWEYSNEEETAHIEISQWQDQSFELTYGVAVNLSDISIYSLS